MAARRLEDAMRNGAPGLLVVILFIHFIFFVVVNEVTVFAGFLFFFFVFLVVQIIRDQIQMDGMRLRNLEFRFAFRATQDFAFFDFVLINIDFGGTFRATNHGSTLRTVL
jgi:hypothetical protein